MELNRVWMSRDTGRKSRYALRTLGGILAIAALAMALVLGGVRLSFALDLPREAALLVLVLAVTALAAALALRLGRLSLRDATVFFLTQDDRLYVMDARALSRRGHSVPDHVLGAMETQKILRLLARQPRVPAGADQILKVTGIRDNGACYVIRCQVRRLNRRPVLRTCFLVKGVEDEELLLRQLERRKSWAGALEAAENRNPFRILASALALLLFAALCVLSHPALGLLPQAIYFPCLGAAFLSLYALVWFILRQRLGE